MAERVSGGADALSLPTFYDSIIFRAKPDLAETTRLFASECPRTVEQLLLCRALFVMLKLSFRTLAGVLTARSFNDKYEWDEPVVDVVGRTLDPPVHALAQP